VYHRAIVFALRASGLKVDTKFPLPVYFRGHAIAEYVADIVVEGILILELKAANSLDSAHDAQILNYLRATDMELGLLLNFGPRPQVRRRIFDNERKQHRGEPDNKPF
jgi:GxxExxY protein